MKVLYLTTSGEIGGGNRSLLTLSAGLLSRGTRVHVVCPSSGPMVEACRGQGIPCEVVHYGQPSLREPRRTWETYRRWIDVLVRTRPDLLHANDLYGARSVTLSRRRLGLPLICHVRFPPTPAHAAWAFRRLPKPNVFLFNSRALRDEAGPQLQRACPNVEQRI